jgi:hypothetical protein
MMIVVVVDYDDDVEKNVDDDRSDVVVAYGIKIMNVECWREKLT